MHKKIYNEILSHNKIIIIRHKSPDYDAYGSQLGLYYALKNTFLDKTILLDGDENNHNIFNKKMDFVTKEDYQESLLIILDTSSVNNLPNDNYKYAKSIIILDHHNNTPSFSKLALIKKDYSSTAELVTEFLLASNIKIPKEAADALYIAIIGDSNRFLYKGTTTNTFLMASALIKSGADIQKDYALMQKDEKILDKRFRGYILNNFNIKDKVAYIYIDKNIRSIYNVSDCFASRGCINMLSGIEGTEAYLIFTEMDDNTISVEFRSKRISILETAKEYGGGGHDLACGARLPLGTDINLIIDKLNEKLRWIYEHL